MNPPVLEPYALQQRWAASRPLGPEQWAALFAAYLARLAGACSESEAAPGGDRPVIGHIKLLALFDDGAYLRVSAVSATHPPTVTGAAPAGVSAVAVTLNVLVYGLPASELAALTAAAAQEVAAEQAVTIQEIPLESTHHAH